MKKKAERLIKILSFICMAGIIALGIVSIVGTGGGGSGDCLSGTIETDSYYLTDEETANVCGDLTILATETVEIAGSLIASGDNGQNITIQADGDVIISGRVIAGNGGAGQDGGTLTIISNNADTTLFDTASIGAGDGGIGQTIINDASAIRTADGDTVKIKSIEGGAGGNGGSVILRAPNGDITIPDIEGIIHIGNGGNGADINVHGEDLLTTELPDQLTNGGGDSGNITIDTDQLLGLDNEVYTIEEDVLDPSTGETIYKAGQKVYIFESKTFLSGGNGGDAGALYYGMDENGESTWPVETAGKYAGIHKSDSLVSYPLQEDGETPCKKGAPGGKSWEGNGGKGGNIFANTISQSSNTDPSGNGLDADNACGIGGKGGDCMQIWKPGQDFCTPGAGGRVYVEGGDGANVLAPGANGGDGGNADARGGDGGDRKYYNAVDKTFTTEKKAGKGGNAQANAGAGGNGGGWCPDDVVSKGGDGGDGGDGAAFGGNWEDGMQDTSNAGTAYATGGPGFSGGDGKDQAGSPGTGGAAVAHGRDPLSINGDNGNPGTTCPDGTTTTMTTTTTSATSSTSVTPTTESPAPKECRCNDPGVQFEVINGTWTNWADCGQPSACYSIFHNSPIPDGSTIQSISSDGKSGCKMKVICP